LALPLVVVQASVLFCSGKNAGSAVEMAAII
jgi:hypothetical protein